MLITWRQGNEQEKRQLMNCDIIVTITIILYSTIIVTIPIHHGNPLTKGKRKYWIDKETLISFSNEYSIYGNLHN